MAIRARTRNSLDFKPMMENEVEPGFTSFPFKIQRVDCQGPSGPRRDSLMQLVMGLGNPGRRYAKTRHNIGFMCLDEVAARLGLTFSQDTDEYLIARGNGPAGPVTLLKPQTYMNLSGEALTVWSQRTGLTVGETVTAEISEAEDPVVPPDVVPLVVCDDLHLPLGSVRIRARGSAGGQNGLASVIEHAHGPGVPRLRLGVGPRQDELDPETWADYVLEDFTAEEQGDLEDLIQRSGEALLAMLDLGPEQAGARFNRRIRRERDLPEADA